MNPITQIRKLNGVALFNKSGQYLHQITKRRAVCLLIADQATPVCSTEEVWKSPTLQINIPKAILLKTRADKFYRKAESWTRDKMLRRDSHTCQYCGTTKGPMTVDHIQPRSKGGKNTWENCVTSCEPCNHKKGDKSLAESGLKLRSTPTKPPVMDDAEIWDLILNSDYEIADGDDNDAIDDSTDYLMNVS